MNKLYKSAKHSEAITRKLIRCYAADFPVKKCSKVSGLSTKQIGIIFGLLRSRMAPKLPALIKKYQRTSGYQQSLLKHRNTQALKMVLLSSGSLKEGRLKPSFDFKSDTSPDVMNAMKSEYQANKSEIDAKLNEATSRAIHATKDYYIDYHKRKKRGLKGIDADYFTKEYTLRWILNEHCRAGDPVDMPLSNKLFHHPKLTVIRNVGLLLGWESKWFEVDAKQADAMEIEILNILEAEPLD